MTLIQLVAIGFTAGVVGAVAVLACSQLVFAVGLGAKLGVEKPIPLESPAIYRPLFWGGLWGALFGLVIGDLGPHLYLAGFLYVLAPLLALYLYFLPKAGAGPFGLRQGGLSFTLYLLLVNLPYGIVTAWVAGAIIGERP